MAYGLTVDSVESCVECRLCGVRLECWQRPKRVDACARTNFTVVHRPLAVQLVSLGYVKLCLGFIHKCLKCVLSKQSIKV